MSASYDIVLAGLGGQGILLASRTLMQAAVRQGAPVSGSETHGMAQRGGSVVAHVRVGPCSSSLVLPGSADLLVALDASEGLRNLGFLAPGAIFLANAPDAGFLPARVAELFERQGVQLRTVDATGLARQAGTQRAANVAILGFVAGLPGVPFTVEGFGEVIDLSVAPKHRDSNRAALALGYAAAAPAPA